MIEMIFTHFSCVVVDVKVRGDKENVLWLQVSVSEFCSMKIYMRGGEEVRGEGVRE